MTTLPSSMRALVLERFDQPPALRLRPVPSLRPGEVLVRVGAAPINPSDLVFLRNQYGVKKPLPVVPGFEGAGVVVAGRGVLGRRLIGRPVAVRAPEQGDGTWAEFIRVPAAHCIPLLHSVTVEEGASFYVNPMTAWSFLRMAKEARAKAIIQTAAASALGRMVARLAQRQGLHAIHLVRRREQVDALRQDGQRHVLNTEAPDFEMELRDLATRLQATLAFDAVGGEVSGQVLSAMPKGSRLIVYGALSGRACAIPPQNFVFEGKRVEGFWLTQWLRGLSLPAKARMALDVQRRLKDDLQTSVQGRFPLERYADAAALYKEKRSDGKVLLCPGLPS